jgi:hypothetical protein
MKLIFTLLGFLLLGCASQPKPSKSKEQSIIDAAIKTHGGDQYQSAKIGFEFRERSFTLEHEAGRFIYTSEQEKDGRTIRSVLDNDDFRRTVDGSAVELSEKDKIRFGNSVNSVIYFALLPYRLNDPAARKTYKGNTKINGQSYEAVEVRFTEQGGGTDHDDVFMYWVNTQTKTVDYLAYIFHVNKGGVRFRKAYNPRMVDGIRFQDYENYKADIDTPLEQLPALYETGNLELLSKIELENIRSL